MDNDINKDALKKFASKSELEQTISVGFQGPPELKLEEKLHHLGEFRERILLSLTKAQVMRRTAYPEIKQALEDNRATKMLIHGNIGYRFRDKYQKMAVRTGKAYTIVHDPDLKGDLGLVVASDQAVDIDNIRIED